ncbi:hypothetical protein ACYULU_13245 [Breznakiellaceae bacterium SP9]
MQKHILPKAGISGDIHLLDCTKITVKLSNEQYEGSSVVTDNEGAKRGYKLATLRTVVGDGGVIEEIRYGTITEHDLSLSRDIKEEFNHKEHEGREEKLLPFVPCRVEPGSYPPGAPTDPDVPN